MSTPWKTSFSCKIWLKSGENDFSWNIVFLLMPNIIDVNMRSILFTLNYMYFRDSRLETNLTIIDNIVNVTLYLLVKFVPYWYLITFNKIYWLYHYAHKLTNIVHSQIGRQANRLNILIILLDKKIWSTNAIKKQNRKYRIDFFHYLFLLESFFLFLVRLVVVLVFCALNYEFWKQINILYLHLPCNYSSIS